MAELHVSKKNISKLLTEMQGRKFIIPDFQRPYKWDIEKCETLWNDIENFTVTEAKSGSDYFLGTIVSYHDEKTKNLEIIDGQQRITSFFLLLRSFYRKLEDMIEDDDVKGLKNQLAPCLWDVDSISQKVTDKSSIHIISEVATEEDNDVFHKILETGNCADESEDNYSINYRFFKGKCDGYAEKNPLQWKQLCVTILQKCIILPIECDTPETALTIFSTLNDRGLPLADSDIFKAQIYRNLTTVEARKEFTNTWKDLTQICKQANISIDDVFRYYSHILRSRNNDKTKEMGLRKFYAEEKYQRLKARNLIQEILILANFWLSVNSKTEAEDDDGYVYHISTEARKHLHCLSCYPNEYWKYATSVFFLKNKGNETFDEDFCNFLKKIISFLFAKFIESPTVNAIKDDIYAACISVQTSNEFSGTIEIVDEIMGKKIDENGSGKMSRALLLLDAYLNPLQHNLIPDTFEVEHIFPRKWQDTNYNGWDIKEAQTYLDKLGNKIVFEKKLNIQAGNNYFGNKKSKYKESKIASVIDLSNYHKNDWVKEDIESRESDFKSRIVNYFKTNLN